MDRSTEHFIRDIVTFMMYYMCFMVGAKMERYLHGSRDCACDCDYDTVDMSVTHPVKTFIVSSGEMLWSVCIWFVSLVRLMGFAVIKQIFP